MRDPLDQATLAFATRAEWETGQSLFDAVAPPTGVFCVLEGQVHLFRLLEKGERKLMHIVDKGHFFLEAQYFYPQTRVILALSSHYTRTAYFSHDKVAELIDGNPRFRRALLMSLAAKALSAEAEIVDLAYAEPAMRMLSVLQDLYRHDCAPGTPPRLLMTQMQLAERVGLHPVTVNRTLKKLEKAGYIMLGRQKIVLLLQHFPPFMPPVE